MRRAPGAVGRRVLLADSTEAFTFTRRNELLWTLSGLNATVGVAVDAGGFIYLGVTDSDFVGSIVRVPPDGSAAEVLVPPDGTLSARRGSGTTPPPTRCASPT